ncbi:hypothetical protein A8C56_07185 [Niabella ginsenosidivorans]|uniref:DUF2442 domain-containing protein n=1 Tax=Niabella ginsenosidivorans TaxID=1176587 RepID=A0A1A9I278_9BACT|nr:DUF2442 domain-containing protein [Niabella ginsenosidivorans]ANH80792.1 hypothetical protein A8C56_07185 [Niabella ginsenosidivorans]
MYLSIKEVQPQNNFQLLLIYNNGEKRLFDMAPYLETGLFRELKDKNIFRTVKPSFDTIEWSNEADIDPEILYKNSVKIN